MFHSTPCNRWLRLYTARMHHGQAIYWRDWATSDYRAVNTTVTSILLCALALALIMCLWGWASASSTTPPLPFTSEKLAFRRPRGSFSPLMSLPLPWSDLESIANSHSEMWTSRINACGWDDERNAVILGFKCASAHGGARRCSRTRNLTHPQSVRDPGPPPCPFCLRDR